MKRSYQFDYAEKAGYLKGPESRLFKAEKIKSVILDFDRKRNYKECVCLDFGCSIGVISLYFSDMFKKIIGIDIDKTALNWAENEKDSKKINNVEFILNRNEKLPLGDKSIDVIICNHTYEHVPNVKAMIKEFLRVLKPNGIIYFGATNKYSLIEPHYNLPFLSWFPKKISNVYLKLFRRGDYYYENLLSYPSIKQLLRGFQVFDYSAKIAKNPEKFTALDVVKENSLITKIPELILKRLIFLFPSWIFILKKRNDENKMYLVNNFDTNTGAGRYAFTLFNELKQKTFIDQIFLDHHNNKVQLLSGNKIKELAKYKKIPFFNNIIFYLRAIKHLRNYKFFHFSNQNLLILRNINPSIVTCHDIATLFYPTTFFDYVIKRYIYRKIDKTNRIIADSGSTKNDLITHYQINPLKIKVIHLGVDHKIFYRRSKKLARKNLGINEKTKIILHVGTDLPRKNVAMILKSFSYLKNKIEDSLFIKIGKFNKNNSNLINELRLKNKIKIFSNLSEKNLSEFYSAADLFVFPSLYEGFGLPVLEAMACGCPVITSSCSSLPEIVSDAAILVDPYDVNALSKAIETVFANSNLREKMISRGLRQAKKFNWEKTTLETLKIYKEVYNNLL
ncbi:MAG: glycosyltransferase [Nanoarchaeota archaeon]|nr:glycosyltransferase [Nanoarchaeota archaeon]